MPPLTAHVNDTAHLLSPAAQQQLEQKLSDYEQKNGRQFALLTIDSLEGDALESFSIRVVEAWKLGKKGKDDGLLLLVANKEHKLRIEVGYGLEGDITDAFSARVIRNVLVPAMRAGNAAGGFDQAFDALDAEGAGEDVAAPQGAADSRAAPAQLEPVRLARAAVLHFADLDPVGARAHARRWRRPWRPLGRRWFRRWRFWRRRLRWRRLRWRWRVGRWRWWRRLLRRRRRRFWRRRRFGLMVTSLLSDADAREVEAAVTRVESGTAAELVVAVVPQSGEHWRGRLLVSLAWAMAAAFYVLEFLPWRSPAVALLIELVVGVLSFSCSVGNRCNAFWCRREPRSRPRTRGLFSYSQNGVCTAPKVARRS